MAKRPKNTISDELKRSKVIITNSAGDDEIISYVSQNGYDKPKLAEGQALLDNANAAVSAETAAQGAQEEATDYAEAAKVAAEKAFQALSEVSKAELKGDKGSLSKLGLDHPMPRATADFIAAGNTLFKNASEDPVIKAKIASKGYTDAKLQSEKGKIAAYDDADTAQEAAKGASHDATSRQVAAMKKLNDWVAEYVRIAKVALKDKPNLLQKLGIRVRKTKTAAQRKAGQKAAATKAAKKAAAGK